MDSDIQGLPGPDLGDIDDVHFMSFLQEIAHEDEPGIGDLNFLGPAVSEAAIPLPASAPNYGTRQDILLMCMIKLLQSLSISVAVRESLAPAIVGICSATLLQHSTHTTATLYAAGV